MQSVKFTMNKEDWKAWAKNAIYFTAPALAVFFVQLSTGSTLKEAWGVAAVAIYGILADFFRKLSAGV